MTVEPYENKLSIEQLRREVRECWDREADLIKALKEAPEMAPPWILDFLSQAAKWPEDHSRGNILQRDLGLDTIPPETECESGAGIWYRIRQGLISDRPLS